MHRQGLGVHVEAQAFPHAVGQRAVGVLDAHKKLSQQFAGGFSPELLERRLEGVLDEDHVFYIVPVSAAEVDTCQLSPDIGGTHHRNHVPQVSPQSAPAVDCLSSWMLAPLHHWRRQVGEAFQQRAQVPLRSVQRCHGLGCFEVALCERAAGACVPEGGAVQIIGVPLGVGQPFGRYQQWRRLGRAELQLVMLAYQPLPQASQHPGDARRVRRALQTRLSFRAAQIRQELCEDQGVQLSPDDVDDHLGRWRRCH
eukprot:scaffold7328_cov314-Pinguiococcus_pyrenoidosus.AAC.36